MEWWALHTHFMSISTEKQAVEKAVQNEQRKKAEFHVQEKGVVTKTSSHAMMQDLVSLGVTVNAAVSCMAGHLGATTKNSTQ